MGNFLSLYGLIDGPADSVPMLIGLITFCVQDAQAWKDSVLIGNRLEKAVFALMQKVAEKILSSPLFNPTEPEELRVLSAHVEDQVSIKVDGGTKRADFVLWIRQKISHEDRYVDRAIIVEVKNYTDTYLKLGQVKQVTDYRDNLFRDVAASVSPGNSRQNAMAVVVHNTRARLSMRFKNLCEDNVVGLVPIKFNGTIVEDEESFLHEFTRRIYSMFIDDEFLKEDVKYNPPPRAGLVTFFVENLEAFRDDEGGNVVGSLRAAILGLLHRLAEKLSTRPLCSARIDEDVAVRWRQSFSSGWLAGPGKMDFALYVNYLLPKVRSSVILIELKDQNDTQFDLSGLQLVEDRKLFLRPTETRTETDAEFLYPVNVESANSRESRLEISVKMNRSGVMLKEKDSAETALIPLDGSHTKKEGSFIDMLAEKLNEIFEDDAFEMIADESFEDSMDSSFEQISDG